MPDLTQGDPTPFRVILRDCRVRLAQRMGLDLNIVNFVKGQEVPTLAGDRDILLRAGQPQPMPGFWEGHGELAGAVVRALGVQLRTRLLQDKTGTCNAWLLGSEPGAPRYFMGHSEFEEKALVALLGHFPLNEQGNIAVCQSLYPLPGDEFKKFVKQDPSWGTSLVTFGILYVPPMPDLYDDPV